MDRFSRLARIVALAVIIAIGIFNVYQAAIHWTLSDAQAYWDAGLRLRSGGDLYPVVTNVEASNVYRYAPWFAWLAVPFTYLPGQVAGALWSAVLLVSSGVALLPIIRLRAWFLVFLFAPILIGISAPGNVQPLMIAALVLGVERRSGPLWIGLAASLKISPILLVAVYLGRREWARAGLGLAVTAALWAPALLYDLSGYTTDAGRAVSLLAIPLLWAAVVALGTGVTLGLARGPFGWLAGATTLVVSLPRLFVYDLTYLMLALPWRSATDAAPGGVPGRAALRRR